MEQTLIQTFDEGVLTLSLNRPDKRNAFDRELYASLTRAFLDASRDAQVRVIRLKGEGASFCAGNDIADFLVKPESGRRTDPPLRLLTAMRQCQVPILAQVEGAAAGIGATLLLHCDLVYATPRTKLIYPFVALGLSPEGGSTVLLPRVAGHVKAFEWLVLGNPCSAQEALEHGLINAVLESAELEGHCQMVAARLAALDPHAVRFSREKLRSAQEVQLDTVMRAEMDLFETLLEGEVAQEALQAFVSS